MLSWWQLQEQSPAQGDLKGGFKLLFYCITLKLTVIQQAAQVQTVTNVHRDARLVTGSVVPCP